MNHLHPDDGCMNSSLPFQGTPGYHLLAALPGPVKKAILATYWPLKAIVEDMQDYTSEMIGHVPVHAIRLWWYRHICRMRIGERSSIHRHCRIYQPDCITIGDNSVINYGVLLDGRGGLCIGDNVSISDGTVILTLEHDVDDPAFNLRPGPVHIHDDVFIGSCARILPGVTLGEGSVIGVGAVVTRDVDPYTVVCGVPARYIRDRSRDLHYQFNYRKRFG